MDYSKFCNTGRFSDMPGRFSDMPNKNSFQEKPVVRNVDDGTIY
jgi:hypothetical protein